MTARFPVRRRIRLSRTAYRSGHCFFITATTRDRHPWFSLHRQLADGLAGIIEAIAEQPNVRLYAWCVMPDHIHLLAQAPDIVETVRHVKGRATPLARALEGDRRLWQRSFFDHALRNDESVTDVAQYIFENPVRAQLVETPPEYAWSGSAVWPDWRKSYRMASQQR